MYPLKPKHKKIFLLS